MSRQRIFRNASLLLRWWSWCVLLFLSALCIALLTVRWLLKDRWDAVALVYYTSPAAAVMSLSMVLSIVWALRRSWIAAFGFSLAALLLLSSTIRVHPAQPVEAGRGYRILFWNPEGRMRDIRQIAQVIHSYDPDFVGLVEAGRNTGRNIERWEQHFPNYEISTSNRELVILSKRPAEPITDGRAGSNGIYRHIRTRIGGSPLDIILADIQSDPLRSRREAIHALTDKALAVEGAVVLLGDFNTPGDSVHFQRLRDAFQHAFDSSGHGYAPTWPLPVPLLQIDHVWVRGLRVHRCEQPWHNISDHRPIIVYLSATDVE